MKKVKALLALTAVVAMVGIASVANAQTNITISGSVTGGASFDGTSTCVTSPNLTPSVAVPDTGDNTFDDVSCTFLVDASGSDYDLQIDETGAAGDGEGAAVEEPGMCSVVGDGTVDDVSGGSCVNYTIADIADGDPLATAGDYIDSGEFGLYMPGTTNVSGASTYGCSDNTSDTCALDDSTVVTDEEPYGQDELWTLHVAMGGGSTMDADTYSDGLTVTLSQD
jgi:hypothetical protein